MKNFELKQKMFFHNWGTPLLHEPLDCVPIGETSGQWPLGDITSFGHGKNPAEGLADESKRS